MRADLKHLLSNIEVKGFKGDLHKVVSSLSLNSFAISENALFFAIKGSAVDGHNFIEDAIRRGASAIVCEKFPDIIHDEVVYILVEDSSYAMAFIAAEFYDNPSRKLKVIGITGTNGKTTIVTLLSELFKVFGIKVGLLSTIENSIGDAILESTHTTPNALELNMLLNEMYKNGCEFVFMEVSSHALAQHRVEGIDFKIAAFTNISHDHLDYHKTFKNYIAIKKKFFDNLSKNAIAIVNMDDRNGEFMLQNTKARQYTYGLFTPCDFKCKILENTFSGLCLDLDGIEMYTRLNGEFNAYNLTLIYAIARLLNMEKIEVLRVLSCLKSARGRFQKIENEHLVEAIVDYAHTPDALKNVLETINSIKAEGSKVICVIGAGGNRDKEKRPIMASVADKYSEILILTADNPRNEEIEDIIYEMEEGLTDEAKLRCLKINSREEAIKMACKLAQPKDIILLAGKGHETYQEIKGVKRHFDDSEMLKKYLGS